MILDRAWNQYVSKHANTKGKACQLEADKLTESLDLFRNERRTSWVKKQMSSVAKVAENVAPWTDIMVAIAQANPISGLVLGIFKAVITLTVKIGKRFDDLEEFEKAVTTTLRFLAKYEERRLGPELDKCAESLYVNILQLLCEWKVELSSVADTTRGALGKSDDFKAIGAELNLTFVNIERFLVLGISQSQVKAIEDSYRQACFDYLIEKRQGPLQLHEPPGQYQIIEAPDSCKWVLQDSKNLKGILLEWHTFLNARNCRMAAFTGAAGTGKTFMALGLARELRHARPDCVVATFFCQEDGRHDDARALLRGVLHQLASEIPQICWYLTNLWEEKINAGKDADTELFSSFQRLSAIFKHVIRHLCPKELELFIILDALNECTKYRDPLLQMLMEIFRSEDDQNIKLVLLTRPEHKILRSLTTKPPKRVTNFEVLELQKASKAMHSIILFHVDEYLARNDFENDFKANVYPPVRGDQDSSIRNESELRQYMVSQLSKHANGNARWVSLVVQALPDGFRLESVLLELENLFHTSFPVLDNLYAKVFSKYGLSEGDFVSLQRTLLLVAGSARALSPKELALAVAILDAPQRFKTFADLQVVEEITVKKWTQFLRISPEDGLTRFDHQSLQEFIWKRPTSAWMKTNYFKDVPQKQEIGMFMLRACMALLTIGFLSNDERGTKPALRHRWDMPNFGTYAARYWPRHMQAADLSQEAIALFLSLCQNQRALENYLLLHSQTSSERLAERDFGITWNSESSIGQTNAMVAAFVSGIEQLVLNAKVATAPINSLHPSMYRYPEYVLMLYSDGRASAAQAETALLEALKIRNQPGVEAFCYRLKTLGLQEQALSITWEHLLHALEASFIPLFRTLYDRTEIIGLSDHALHLFVALCAKDEEQVPARDFAQIMTLLVHDSRIDFCTNVREADSSTPSLFYTLVEHRQLRWLKALFKNRTKQELEALLTDNATSQGKAKHALSRAILDIQPKIAEYLLSNLKDHLQDQLEGVSRTWPTVIASHSPELLDTLLTEFAVGFVDENDLGEPGLLVTAVDRPFTDDGTTAQIVSLLLATGMVEVEANSTQVSNETALEIAAQRGYKETVRILIEQGDADWGWLLSYDSQGDPLWSFKYRSLRRFDMLSSAADCEACDREILRLTRPQREADYEWEEDLRVTQAGSEPPLAVGQEKTAIEAPEILEPIQALASKRALTY